MTVDVGSKTIRNGEVSVTLYFSYTRTLNETLIDSALKEVPNARLVYLGTRDGAKEPTQQYRLTVTGDLVRATGVQNVIAATIMGDNTRRNRLVRAVNVANTL